MPKCKKESKLNDLAASILAFLITLVIALIIPSPSRSQFTKMKQNIVAISLIIGFIILLVVLGVIIFVIIFIVN